MPGLSMGLGLGLSRRGGGGGILDPSAGYEHHLPFSAASPTYRVGASTYSPVTALPGYAYTRTGAKGEVNALSGSDRIDDFAANVAGIVPSVGYWSRGALTNLTLQSQDFTSASWTANNCTVAANNVVAPDGATTADTLTATGAQAQVYQAFTPTVATHTTSVFIPAGGTAAHAYIQINADTSIQFVTINRATGALGSVQLVSGVGIVITAYSVAVGTGWRLVLVWTPLTAAAGFVCAGLCDAANSRVSTTGITGPPWQHQTILGNHPDGGPIIVTAGATLAIGADVLAHTMAAPTDVDQVFFAKVNQPALGSVDRYALQFDDGTDANRMICFLSGGGVPNFIVTAASVTAYFDTVAALVAGQDTILVVRRLGGNWRCGKIVAGVLTWAPSVAGAMPTGMVNVRPGANRTGGAQLDGIVLNQGLKVGTFTSDAEVIAAVSI